MESRVFVHEVIVYNVAAAFGVVLMKRLNERLLTVLMIASIWLVGAQGAFAQSQADLQSCYALRDSGKYRQGVKRCTELISRHPKSSKLYFYRAECHSLGGNQPAAIVDYSKALALDPKNTGALVGRADAYRQAKQPAKAIADCNKALSIEPAIASAYCNRGEAEVDLKRYDDAIIDLTRTIEMLPKSGEAHYYRSLAFKGRGDSDKAEQDLKKAYALGYKEGRQEVSIDNNSVKPAAEPQD